MKLIFPENLASADPVIPVQWCLDRSETEHLKKDEAKNIHILVVIAYEGTKMEDRYLVPIDQMMTYISFRRPGKHTVFAKVVYDYGLGSFVPFLLRKLKRREYDCSVLNNDNTDFMSQSYFRNFGILSLPADDEVEISIPREHFPPAPPEWLKKMANYGFSYPAVDECDFRRRVVLLVPKLPALAFWAVVTTLIRLTIALYLLLDGRREIGFGSILHPWRNDINDVFMFTRKSNTWFRCDKVGNPRSLWFLLLHPELYIVLFSIVTAVKISLGISYRELFGMIWALAMKCALRIWSVMAHLFSDWWTSLLVVAILFFLLKKSLVFIGRRLKEKQEKESTSEFRLTQRQLKEKEYDELYKLLTCVRAPHTPSLENLPKQKRSVKLRYFDLKAKVCRPFADR